MLEHIANLSLSPKSIEMVRYLERKIEELIAHNPEDSFIDGKLNIQVGSNSNMEYGLGRTKNRFLVECIAKDVLQQLKLDESTMARILPESDLLIFSEVEEHTDDHGLRYLAVLRASNGFEINTEDEEGEIYSDVLYDREIYLFNENLPHSVTRHTFVKPTLYDRVDDYCIAINMPYRLHHP